MNFYDNDPGQPFVRWALYMGEAARLARRGVEARYGRESALHLRGGHLQRRLPGPAGGGAVPRPLRRRGGLGGHRGRIREGPNLLTDLPPAILNFPDYAGLRLQPGQHRGEEHPRRRVSAGPRHRHDLAVGPLLGASSGRSPSASGRSGSTRPTTRTVRAPGRTTTSPVSRHRTSGAQVASFATTGRHPAAADHGGRHDGRAAPHRPPRARLRPEGRGGARGPGPRRRRRPPRHAEHWRPAYRLYEVQNGNHIETFKLTFPQLEFIEPHAQRAFDLLVASVEHGAKLPPSQCIPRGGGISSSPAKPGHCSNLLAP